MRKRFAILVLLVVPLSLSSKTAQSDQSNKPSDISNSFLPDFDKVIDKIKMERPPIPCDPVQWIQAQILIWESNPMQPMPNLGFEGCYNFIDKRGFYGPWGKEIAKQILQLTPPDLETKCMYVPLETNYFLDPNVVPKDVAHYCPNYPKLTKAERLNFWVWTLTMLAADESGCDPDRVAPNCTTGVGVGLYQLPGAKSGRTWRGKACFGTQKEMLIPETQLRCSVSIMHQLLAGKKGVHQTSGGLFAAGSYWEVLRKFGKTAKDKKIRLFLDRVRQLKICQD